MTTLQILGVASGLVLVVFGVVVLVHLARDYAEDRRREAEYAHEWAEIHRRNRERGR